MIKLEFSQCTHQDSSRFICRISTYWDFFGLLWLHARCELDIEFNNFLAQFHEKMNFHKVSASQANYII